MNTNTILAVMAFVALSTTALAADKVSPSAVKIPPTAMQNIKVDGLGVYSLVTPRVSATRATNFARHFVNPSASARLLESEYVYTNQADPSSFLVMDAQNGNVAFASGLSKYFGPNKPSLPNAENARAVAKRFLSKNYLMPTQAEQVTLAHVGGLSMASTEPGSDRKPIQKLVTLHFTRTIDGRPVVGSGSKIVVHIGHQGEVVGMTHKWREAKLLRTLGLNDLVPTSALIDRVRRDVANEWSGADGISIQSMDIGYYDGDGSFLQPLLVYEAQIRRGSQVSPYLGFVPLMKDVPELVGQPVPPREAFEMIQAAPAGR